MPLTESQIAEIEKLIDEGRDSHQIADKLGVRLMSVAGVRARIKRVQNQASAEDEELVDEAIIGKFGLESDLQEALRANIGQLEAEMKVIDGGKEKTVASGRIDIMAEDNQGSTVVIELKAGTADHNAIGQLVAGDFSARAKAAARAVPSIALRQYAFQFSFQAIK